MSGKGDMSQKLLGATTNTFQHVLLDHTAAKTIKLVSCYIKKKYLPFGVLISNSRFIVCP